MSYTLLALALAPGIAISLFMYWRDSHNREPLKWLLLCFLLGALSIVPAIFIEQGIDIGLKQNFPTNGVLYNILNAFVSAALVEELLKYCMLRWAVYNKKAFDEPLDGIVYAVMVSMGFATVENIMYVYNYGFNTAIMRMVLAVPGHAFWTLLMGYYVGLAKFNKGSKGNLYILKGIFLAILFHGTYDACIFLSESGALSEYVTSGLLVIGAIASHIIALILCIRAVRIHRKKSKLQKQKNVDHPSL